MFSPFRLALPDARPPRRSARELDGAGRPRTSGAAPACRTTPRAFPSLWGTIGAAMVQCRALWVLLAACSPPASLPDWDRDGFPDLLDCAPSDAAIHPGASDTSVNGVDEDCSATDGIDGDGDGVAQGEGASFDCDDSNAARHPGLDEVPDDGVDQDCDGSDLRCDGDGDGFTSGSAECGAFPGLGLDCDDAVAACTDESSCHDEDTDGDRVCDGDCDDGNAERGPSALEGCDGVDNDCDSVVPNDENDADLDGVPPCAGDCSDGNAAISPVAVEVCDAFDNDCDGQRLLPQELDQDLDGEAGCTDCDDGDPARSTLDADGDGTSTCALVPDCDDQEPLRAPGRPDSAGDGFDQNCDGIDGTDGDGDGLAASAGDCDDTTALCAGAADCHDDDGDGFRVCDGDCADDLASAAPGSAEVCDGADSDCDGAVPLGEEDLDADSDPACSDCDDLDPNRSSVDADGDGLDTCASPPDCDDTVAARRPGLPDNPGNAFDENCDGIDGIDADGDGLAAFAGDCDDSTALCQGPTDCADVDGDAQRVCDGDCDDSRSAVLGGGAELCDGLDSDCDGLLPADEQDGDVDGDPTCSDCDDADGARTTLDLDGDLVTTCDAAPDCDDTDDAFAPLALDPPGDGGDQNCDGVDGVDLDGDGLAAYITDCDDADAACTTFASCADQDLDNHRVCDGDCRDGDPTAHPGAAEQCDGEDTDCDGILPPEDADTDADGDPACTDCDDLDAARTTLDADGDGETSCATDCDDDDFYLDTVDHDADGVSACAGDCSDFNPALSPLASELCDGVDNDCDSVVPLVESDGDGDFYPSCLGDCDDADASTHPTASDASCDGVDSDCDGDASELDADGDGSMPCSGDCDDADEAREALDVDGDGQSTCGVACIVNNLATYCNVDCDDGSAVIGSGFAEICDGLDDSCDGAFPAQGLDGEVDNDGDGWVECEPWVGAIVGVLGGDDCQDADTAYNPAAPDICDGVDTNCNGSIDEVGDSDGDGFCLGDCNDADPLIHPGFWSDGIWNNLDESCDGSDFYEAFGVFGTSRNGGSRVFGWYNTVIGDMNGDAIDDWISVDTGANACTYDAGTNHWIWYFAGADVEETNAYYGYLDRSVEPYKPILGAVRTPDLTGDDLPDLLLEIGPHALTWATSTVELFPSQGWFVGAWARSLVYNGGQASLVPREGFDMDGDGLHELVLRVGSGFSTYEMVVQGSTLPAAMSTSSGGTVYTPNATAWTITPPYGFQSQRVLGTVGDLDDDGGPEPSFALTDGPSTTLRIFHSGSFTTPAAIDLSSAWVTISGIPNSSYDSLRLASEDWNGDGIADLWAQGYDRNAFFFDGATLAAGGAFTAADADYTVETRTPLNHWERIAAQQGDLDGDGLLDLVACSPYDTIGGSSPSWPYNPDGGCRIWSGADFPTPPYTMGWWNAAYYIVGEDGTMYGQDPTAGADVNFDGIDDLIAGWIGGTPTPSASTCHVGGMRVEIGRTGY